MSVRHRNKVSVSGQGTPTVVFAHGFGCDQTVWRFMRPAFEERYRVVTYDLTGCGGSDLARYDRTRYATLTGHVHDLLDVIAEFGQGPVIFVGHSVGATIGMLASIVAPERFLAQVMVAPSPCFLNDAGYTGGFSRGDIDELLETMDANYLGWSRNLAAVVMGAPDSSPLTADLASTFCRNDPEIARHFARVTFLADHRADVARVTTPVLILQASDDLLAPLSVGDYLYRNLPGSRLHVVHNVGHCPHMSAPGETARAALDFLAELAPPP